MYHQIHSLFYLLKYENEKSFKLLIVWGVFQKYAEKSHNFTSAAWILLKLMDIIHVP